jgi:hypothetical protein
VPALDSIYGLTATAYNAAGKRVTPAITWTVRPEGHAVVLPAATGHTATVAGVTQGVAYVVVNATVSETPVTDSLKITVKPARVVTVVPFTHVHRDGFTGRPVPDATVAAKNLKEALSFLAQPRGGVCMYGAAYDRRNNVLTGLALQRREVQVDTGPWQQLPAKRAGCPDTSVDPARIAP